MTSANIKLGPRLKTIASYVPQGSRLGDIGTDHAYLPAYLVRSGVIPSAIGVDIHQGPYESARETVEEHGLTQVIDVRQGDGLLPLRPGEVDTLVIAGMGGTTILEILGGRPEVLKEVSRLILQPQGAEARVRKELISAGWKLKDECLLEEEGRIYTVLVLTKTEGLDLKEIETIIRDTADKFIEYVQAQTEDPAVPKELNIPERTDNFIAPVDQKTFIAKYIWFLGPINIRKRSECLQRIIKSNIINLQSIVQEMKKTMRTEIQAKSRSVEQETKLLEVMYRWLFQ